MATYTPNLNLKKPSTGEKYDVVADLNDAKDKIDTAIGNNTTNIINILKYKQLVKADGSWSDAIDAALADIQSDFYAKGGAKIIFPVPDTFYKITRTIDLTEKWNVTLECPSYYNHQRQGLDPDFELDYSLFHWFGTVGEPMVVLDYSFGNELKNITLNGRKLASVGFAIGKTGLPETSVKYLVGYNNGARYCDVGIRIGDNANPDIAPIHFYNTIVEKNKNVGIKVFSGNASVNFHGLTASENGENPTVGEIGTNIYLESGDLVINGYMSDGKPTDGDIYQESGGIRINGAWSDVSQGLFMNSIGSTSASNLTGVRHYDGAMTLENTPKSIVWQGPQPLVLEGCYLFNSVEVVSGNMGHVIDIGTRFHLSTAKFMGTAIENQRGYIGLGGSGQNEARLSVGKPPRNDVGDSVPSTFWAENQRPTQVRTTGNFAMTDKLNANDNSEEILANCYYDGAVYKAVQSGKVWKIRREKGSFAVYQAPDATISGQTVTFSELYSIGQFYNGTFVSQDGWKTLFNSSAPTMGTWGKGDYCRNSNPIVGNPKGWICTVAGTPGTWVSEGNL